MLRLTLAQMRRSLGRLVAAGVAIVIGTAFVAATLVAGDVITRTSLDAVAAGYADADLVVTAPPEAVTAGTVTRLRDLPEVAGADARSTVWAELSAGGTRVYSQVSAVASHPRLEPQEVVAGRLPRTAGEVSLPTTLAERLDVEVGDVVPLTRETWRPDADGADGGDGAWVSGTEDVRVSGTTEDTAGAFTASGGVVLAHPADVERWSTAETLGGGAPATTVVVALTDPTAVEAGRSAVQAAVPGSLVRTKDEEALEVTRSLTDGSDVFTAVVLGFAAVALLVAALVITNTFSVLVAQRTRLLALLRCVGADRSQLRRSVLTEAALLGLVSSAVGLLTGLGLAQLTLVVLGRADLDVPLPTTVSLTPAVIAAPLVVGTLVTVLAALAPARAATRVAPLAALRPADAPSLARRRSIPRLVLSVVLTVVGLGLLAAGAASGAAGGELASLGLGVLGGALSFVGVLVGAVFWVPAVVGLLGRALAPTGTSARLAAANTVRNPRRTAATSAALLIGVTLVAMMSTGAATARSTLGAELEAHFPVDVVVGGTSAEGEDVADGLAATVGAIPGVQDVVPVRSVPAELTTAGGDTYSATAYGAEPVAVATVLRAPEQAAGLDPGTVLVPAAAAELVGVRDGDPVSVAAVDARGMTGGGVERTAVLTDLSSGFLVTPATLEEMGGSGTATDEVWLRLSDTAAPDRVVADVQDALADTPVGVTGAALERARFESIIDTLLAVVVGLLAAAVVIAVIGVANTLSLSVIERRRESATLRAIGLSRGRLRASLAVEGLLIAGVGAVVGIVLGVVYGWAGTTTVLGVVGEVRLTVPWRDLALVLVVALVAGLLASVLPGRAAARTSPVEALAVE